MDSWQHVNPGDPIRLAASQINGLNRLLRVEPGETVGEPQYEPLPYSWVMAQNNGGDVGRWSVLAITGMAVTPTSSPGTATAQFERMPVVACQSPTATTTAWGVAVEPIKSGAIGRLAVGGVVQVKGADVGKAAGAAVLWKDANWALVRIDACVVRGTFSGSWGKGATKTVTDAVTNSKTYTAKNYFSSLTGVGTKACAIAQAGGEWILIAAEC